MSEPSDSYRSVEDGPETELKVKGSRFLGQVFLAPAAADADERLAAVRKRHHAATHHCWARRVGGPEALTERYDDGGEPSGTAGPPILAPIASEDLHHVLVVVTRYYGGTKLGTGGLARAYADAAKEALAAAPRRTIWRESVLTVRCSYADMGAVEAILAREGARVRACDRDFTSGPVFRVTVLQSDGPRLDTAIREGTAARAEVLTVMDGERPRTPDGT